MSSFSSQVKTADWKSEKHVPVIECPDKVDADQFFTVKATLGKAVAHPNTTEHHIRWIDLYFTPEGAPVPVQVAHFDFSAHGESAAGANAGPVTTNHEGCTSMKTSKGGTLLAVAYCNIHGVWESEKPITLA